MRLIKTSIDFVDYDNNQDILLGAWCLKNLEDILGSFDKYNKIPYHWDDREKYAGDYIYLTELYEANLSQLAGSLNTMHSTNYDLSYWRIVIGPWLRYFIDALFDRYECVKQAKEIGCITKSTIYSYDLDDICPASFDEFWSEFTTDEWNEIILSECFQDLEIPYTQSSENLVFRNHAKLTYFDILRASLIGLANMYSKLLGRLQSGPIIHNSYVPLKKIINFHFRLKKLPYFFKLTLDFPPSKTNLSLREKLSNITIASKGFESVLARLIPSFIPKSYVEDFPKLRANALKTLPKNPTSIFTANAYQADEMFKVWAAEKVSNGVPLIIGQHGGTFGMAAVNQSEEHQLKIADKWLSWGWDCALIDNIVKFPSLQLSGRAFIKPRKNGDILHVLSSMPRYFYQHFSMPVAGQFLLYIKNQLNFLDGLEINYLDSVRIRLDSSNESRGWNIPKALDVAGYSTHVDQSNERIPSLLSRSRLCICTHNATVFLECLEMNFPTIIFWEPSHHEIRSDAVPFFDLLLEAGILFYTPEEAARKVNNVAHNVDEWWFSDEVQSARKKFCYRYAATSSDWELEWREFLLGVKKIL